MTNGLFYHTSILAPKRNVVNAHLWY